ncbi:protein LEAD-SENSITIVE 1-like [Corylus avellana]|uniref:protein LEAD-SENSITIVE 1-like n=1 Tax=Corylus avellana TaxID=13451 RepID=UPI001E21BAEA|nr:protein LEAD-SENSITIVE 1-like [Corylus avellana]
MGVLINRVERSEIKPGDHIYTYRAAYTYSHHGIFVGENKVVHFTAQKHLNSSSWASSGSSLYNSMITCSSYPECGFRKPNSGVLRSCLDCFLRNGSLYRYEYGVSKSVFLAHVRGGTCSTAKSDPPEEVTRRALYLLQTGFGNYDLLQNNCEDFALYCKTGLVIEGKVKTEGSGQKKGNKLGVGVGASGQVSSVSSVFDAASEAIRYSTLKSLVSRATVMAAMYFLDRYATDIGVRDDVIKMAVEDLAVNMGWEGHHGEEADDTEASKQDFITMNSGTSFY